MPNEFQDQIPQQDSSGANEFAELIPQQQAPAPVQSAPIVANTATNVTQAPTGNVVQSPITPAPVAATKSSNFIPGPTTELATGAGELTGIASKFIGASQRAVDVLEGVGAITPEQQTNYYANSSEANKSLHTFVADWLPDSPTAPGVGENLSKMGVDYYLTRNLFPNAGGGLISNLVKNTSAGAASGFGSGLTEVYSSPEERNAALKKDIETGALIGSINPVLSGATKLGAMAYNKLSNPAYNIANETLTPEIADKVLNKAQALQDTANEAGVVTAPSEILKNPSLAKTEASLPITKGQRALLNNSVQDRAEKFGQYSQNLTDQLFSSEDSKALENIRTAMKSESLPTTPTVVGNRTVDVPNWALQNVTGDNSLLNKYLEYRSSEGPSVVPPGSSDELNQFKIWLGDPSGGAKGLPASTAEAIKDHIQAYGSTNSNLYSSANSLSQREILQGKLQDMIDGAKTGPQGIISATSLTKQIAGSNKDTKAFLATLKSSGFSDEQVNAAQDYINLIKSTQGSSLEKLVNQQVVGQDRKIGASLTKDIYGKARQAAEMNYTRQYIQLITDPNKVDQIKQAYQLSQRLRARSSLGPLGRAIILESSQNKNGNK